MDDFRGLPSLHRKETGITVAAMVGCMVVEVVEDRLASTTDDFTKAEHRIQFAAFVAFVLLIAFAIVEHLTKFDNVL